ncbi:hypothetical protein VTJ04DRAFT_1040 [Mycothermus thermophilus]|uniref:uncharacterized protein n=1 Tax=Humicola insolens TaxID=85995 RepID=UPI003742AAF9
MGKWNTSTSAGKRSLLLKPQPGTLPAHYRAPGLQLKASQDQVPQQKQTEGSEPTPTSQINFTLPTGLVISALIPISDRVGSRRSPHWKQACLEPPPPPQQQQQHTLPPQSNPRFHDQPPADCLVSSTAAAGLPSQSSSLLPARPPCSTLSVPDPSSTLTAHQPSLFVTHICLPRRDSRRLSASLNTSTRQAKKETRPLHSPIPISKTRIYLRKRVSTLHAHGKTANACTSTG